MRNVLFAAAAVLALSGCGDVLGGGGELEVRTSAMTYALTPADGGVEIPFTVVNDTGGDVAVFRCGEAVVGVLVRREADGSWKDASGAACIAIYPAVPLVLEPGEEVTGRARALQPGEYRINIFHGGGLRGQQDERAVSNEFTVE